MRSPEKVLRFIEELESFSDAEISEALPVPVPAPVLRLSLAAVSSQVPDDPAELDVMLTHLGEFALNLRSDDDAHETAQAPAGQ